MAKYDAPEFSVVSFTLHSYLPHLWNTLFGSVHFLAAYVNVFIFQVVAAEHAIQQLCYFWSISLQLSRFQHVLPAMKWKIILLLRAYWIYTMKRVIVVESACELYNNEPLSKKLYLKSTLISCSAKLCDYVSIVIMQFVVVLFSMIFLFRNYMVVYWLMAFQAWEN